MEKNENLFAPRFDIKDVTIHKKERLFKRYFAIDHYLISYKRFDGKECQILDREVFERDTNAVAVLAYDIKTNEAVFIEQFRPGALKDEISPWLIEIVAGLIDEGESPLQAAMRETYEEIGLKLQKENFIEVLSEYATPGGVSEKVTLFIANADLSNLGNHGGLVEEGEDIRIFKAPLDKAYAEIKTGRIRNSIAIVAIQHLMLEKENIVKHFQK